MRATFARIPEGLYAFGDSPFRVRWALGGPFQTQEDAFLWLIDRNEAALTPTQKAQWALLHDGYVAWLRVHQAAASSLDRLAGLLGLVDGLETGKMFGAGNVTLATLAKYAAGDGWRPVFEKLEAAAIAEKAAA